MGSLNHSTLLFDVGGTQGTDTNYSLAFLVVITIMLAGFRTVNRYSVLGWVHQKFRVERTSFIR